MKSLMTNVISLLLIAIGYVSPIYGEPLKACGYFAFSGAITNWLAIYMLFEKVPYLYGSGVIPMHFMEFKQGIKALILEQFFSLDSLETFFNNENTAEQNQAVIESLENSVDFENIFDQLVEVILQSSFGSMLNLLGGKKALENLRVPCIARLKIILNEVSQEKIMPLLPSKKNIPELLVKIEEIVDFRLAQLSPEMVKHIVQNMIRKHLGWLVIWGGVFGGLIGLGMNLIEQL